LNLEHLTYIRCCFCHIGFLLDPRSSKIVEIRTKAFGIVNLIVCETKDEIDIEQKDPRRVPGMGI
jgi:hypothetical protein